LRKPPTEQLRILLLLLAKPDNGAETTRGQLGCLLETDHGATITAYLSTAGVSRPGADDRTAAA
jgi:hypothetical protein